MMKRIAILLAMMSLPVHAEVISVSAQSLPPQGCKQWKTCEIPTHHEIHIINASLSNETFHYMYQACMQGLCTNAQNMVVVKAGERWDNSYDGHLYVKLDKGKYNYEVRTECGKEKALNSYSFKI